MVENSTSLQSSKKEFSAYFKLREYNYCYYPLHLDPYGGGCYHDCAYCFQKDQLCFRNEKDHLTKARKPTSWRPDDPSVSPFSKIEKLFQDVFENGQGVFTDDEVKEIKENMFNNSLKKSEREKYAQKFSLYCLTQRMPLRIGGVVDPFQPIEKSEKVTLKILKLLNKYNYPAQIVTKSTLVVDQEYLDVITEGKDNFFIQMTLTTLDDQLAKELEPNVPAPNSRLEALSAINQKSIRTAVRINPLYPQVIYDTINESYEDFIKGIASTGTKTVIVGGLRVMTKDDSYGPVATAEFVNNALCNDTRFQDFDIKKVLKKRSGTYYISKEELFDQYKLIKKYCDYYNMSFSICYDSNENAEDKELMELWNCKRDCCNGYDNVPGFKVTFKDLLNRG